MTLKRFLTHGLMVAALLLAGYLLYGTFSKYSFEQIKQSVAAIPGWRLLLALLFAACSYVCLSLFDALALRYVGKPLSLKKTMLASFVSLSLGHNIGFAGFSSGAIRYRFYSRWGLNLEDVAKIILFCGVTVGLGLAMLTGIVFVVDPQKAASLLGTSAGLTTLAGWFCLITPLLYCTLAFVLRTPLKIWKWSFAFPRPILAVGQVVIGTVNFAFVSACLHQLLSAFGDVGYLQAATAYVSANTAILITHVPGGLGVLEATVAHMVPNEASIGALVAFRVIYFFVPMFCGLPLFLFSEVARRREKAEREEAGEIFSPPHPAHG